MSGWGTIYNNASHALGIYSRQLLRLQEQVSSGERVVRPSDSPTDASRILDLQARKLSIDSYVSNLDDVSRNLTNCSQVLTDMSDLLGRVRELLSQVASGTYNAGNRLPAAGEIDSILEQAVSLANTRNLGRYVFSGLATTTVPYVAQRVDGKITSVSYQGGRDELSVPVGIGMQYSGTMVGDKTFRTNDPQAPQFEGLLGASEGTGTSNVRGDVWLTVRQTGTVISPGATGIGAGASSGQDTVIGTHTVTIDADNHTIRLGDGTAVDYTNAELNLADVKLTSSSGDVVHLNLTAMTVSGVQTIEVSGSGDMSIDGGLTQTPISFDANQALTDSRTGRTLYVDSTALHRSGAERVSVPGTYDIFSALIDARDVLRNSQGMTESQQVQMISHMSDVMVELSAQVTQQLTTTGGRLQGLQSLRRSLETMQNSAKDQVALLQDADIVEVATKLAHTQTLYEMTLLTTNKLLSLSLLDFIR